MEAEEIKLWIDEFIDAKDKIVALSDFKGMDAAEICIREIHLNAGFEDVANAIGSEVHEFDCGNFVDRFFFYRGYKIMTFANKKSSDNTDQSTVTTNA